MGNIRREVLYVKWWTIDFLQNGIQSLPFILGIHGPSRAHIQNHNGSRAPAFFVSFYVAKVFLNSIESLAAQSIRVQIVVAGGGKGV